MYTHASWAGVVWKSAIKGDFVSYTLRRSRRGDSGKEEQYEVQLMSCCRDCQKSTSVPHMFESRSLSDAGRKMLTGEASRPITALKEHDIIPRRLDLNVELARTGTGDRSSST